MSPQDRRDLVTEVNILRTMNHQYIISFHAIFEDKLSFYVVTELMQGGHLMDRIVQRTSYTEKDARQLCHRILEAIDYCHSNHVVHRDIKPENILLTNRSDDLCMKLADFGFAKVVRIDEEDSLTTACGTWEMHRSGSHPPKP
jgi:serine/threonine protein kinase